MANLKFKHVDENVFKQLQSELSSLGINVSGDSGSINRNGFRGSFQRDTGSQSLAISVDKTPMLVPKSIVIKRIKDTIQRCGGTQI